MSVVSVKKNSCKGGNNFLRKTVRSRDSARLTGRIATGNMSRKLILFVLYDGSSKYTEQ